MRYLKLEKYFTELNDPKRLTHPTLLWSLVYVLFHIYLDWWIFLIKSWWWILNKCFIGYQTKEITSGLGRKRSANLYIYHNNCIDYILSISTVNKNHHRILSSSICVNIFEWIILVMNLKVKMNQCLV